MSPDLKLSLAVRWAALAILCAATATLAAADSREARTKPSVRAATFPSQNPAPAFAIRREDSGWWLVSPKGDRFFSRGVCVLTQGASRETFDPENPAYAAWQQYDTAAAWAVASLRRLKSWGFTTAGGWSDFATLPQAKEQPLWLTPVLHIGSTAGAPWWDMWDAKNIRRMEEVARAQIVTVRDDPRLLGYYSDNELGWWNATLWKMTLEQTPSSGQRQRLVRLLREVYRNDWTRLLQDFEPENARNWKDLQRGGMLFLKSGGNGIKVMRRFLGFLAGRYYQLMRDIIRKFDDRALFLGDRYQSFYYPEVVRAAAPYVDAISSNLNANWNDGTYLRWYLDTLHALSGKPVLVSEFYLAAKENRSGNRNSAGIYPLVTTQAERGEAARNTLAALLRLPYVIGADWFQFADEPTHGRGDGENFNFGLVDIHDQPYDEVTSVFASLDAENQKAKTTQPRPDASLGVPRAPPEPFDQFEPTRALKHWDRERGFVKSSSDFPMADLYLCWTPQALYIGLYSIDMVEDAYYRGGIIPKNDRALWTVQISDGKAIRARIGAGREPLVSDDRVRVENLSGRDLNVRNVAAMELPVTVLGKERLTAGDTIELECTLLTHFQAQRFEWKGSFVLNQ